jgi:hypothetical protein
VPLRCLQITNPNNTIENNVAAGEWGDALSLSQTRHCMSLHFQIALRSLLQPAEQLIRQVLKLLKLPAGCASFN